MPTLSDFILHSPPDGTNHEATKARWEEGWSSSADSAACVASSGFVVHPLPVAQFQFVYRAFAALGDGPGVGPEAEVDHPPVRGGAGLVQFGKEDVEREDALAEGGVGGGLIVVEGAVGVDQVDVADLAAEALGELQGAAGEDLALAGLAGADGGDHVRVGGVGGGGAIRVAELASDDG